jgi:hypothetical protein
MTAGKRPWGVSLMAVLYFIGAGFYVVLLSMALAVPTALHALLNGLSPQGSGPAILLNLGRVLAIYFTIMIVVAGLLGYGMWALKNWSRLITAFITAVSLIVGIVFFVRIASGVNPSTLLLELFRVGLCVLVLWYLWRPNVRAAFRSRSYTAVQ